MVRGSAIIVGAVAVVMLATTPATPRSRFYKHKSLLSMGYKDKQIASGRWRVSGQTNEPTAQDVALALAMYRSALLVKRAGYPYLQVVKTQHVRSMDATFMQFAELEVVGVQSAAAPVACRNKDRNVHLCRNFPVDTLIAEAGAELRHSRTEIAEDLAAVSRTAAN